VTFSQGDVVNRKGGFEGGFRDERSSKLGAVGAQREAAGRLRGLEEQEAALKTQTDHTDHLIDEVRAGVRSRGVLGQGLGYPVLGLRSVD